MTDEIIKLYKNTGIKKVRQTNITGGDYPIAVGFEDYPPFTAEKQLELIKWLMNNPKDFFSWTIQQQGKDIKYAFYVGYEYGGSRFLEFTEALADILNNLWQDLTEEERTEIRSILNG